MYKRQVSTLIKAVTAQLSAVGIEDPAINARLLIRQAFGWSATHQLNNLSKSAPTDQLPLLESLVKRRKNREPLSYITGKAEFFKRQFSVDERVLIPRPESEQLVAQTINYVQKLGIEHPRIADIGTGSGCIMLSILKELRHSKGLGIDICRKTIINAKINIKRMRLENRGKFSCRSVDQILNQKFDLIVSNPPYVLKRHINPAKF